MATCLSVRSLFELFQEVACEHATQNRFGFDDLYGQGLFWALSHVKVQVNRILKWTERFNLTTWPRRPDAFKDVIPIRSHIRATSSNAQRIDIPGGNPISTYEITAKISDIHVNGHVNNAKLLQWAIDSFRIDYFKNRRIFEIHVNYWSEEFYGDAFQILIYNMTSNCH